MLVHFAPSTAANFSVRLKVMPIVSAWLESPLKKLLMERGVPKETVFACANKFQLIEVGKKWGPELKIQFTED